MNSKYKIIVTGGGTGGHLYPALAIIESIDNFAEIHYVGHPDKIEGRVVPTKNIPFYGIRFNPFPTSKLKYFSYFFHLLLKIFAARKIARELNPDLVIAVGGFVSVLMALATLSKRIPLIIHEQNVHPGKANRLLMRLKVPVMITFDKTREYVPHNEVYLTGCPVRNTIGAIPKSEARVNLGIPMEDKVVLIVGGSGGAKALNAIVPSLVQKHQDRTDLHLLITGRAYYTESVKEAKNMFDAIPAQYNIIDYADNIDTLFAASDIAISRSGSSTVNELLCAGLPAILIPSPNVAENHQEANARYVEQLGAGKVILEKDLNVDDLSALLQEFWNSDTRLSEMSRNAKENCGGKFASQRLQETILMFISKSR